jgi:hypothetical protein
MFGFSIIELIGLGAIILVVGGFIVYALKSTKGSGGHDRWGR